MNWQTKTGKIITSTEYKSLSREEKLRCRITAQALPKKYCPKFLTKGITDDEIDAILWEER